MPKQKHDRKDKYVPKDKDMGKKLGISKFIQKAPKNSKMKREKNTY